MKTPVVLIIFDRPNQTQKVFDAIKKQKPEILLVIADGPRTPQEKIKCDVTRKIIDTVDWKCDVRKYYSEKNLGCRTMLSSGLNWAFGQVDRAIVFEDDCLPNDSFFPFCEELLEKYADDSRIMHIGGNFFQHRNQNFKCPDDYYFSRLPHIWGWATWSRAWKHFDVDMKSWPEIKARGGLKNSFSDPAVYEYWQTVWDGYYNKTVMSWDGQWAFACMINNGLSIVPAKNLVSNIGFGPDATQTKDPTSIFANIKTEIIQSPLKHPMEICPNYFADAFTWKQNFGIDAKLKQRVLGGLRRNYPAVYQLAKKLVGKQR